MCEPARLVPIACRPHSHAAPALPRAASNGNPARAFKSREVQNWLHDHGASILDFTPPWPDLVTSRMYGRSSISSSVDSIHLRRTHSWHAALHSVEGVRMDGGREAGGSRPHQWRRVAVSRSSAHEGAPGRQQSTSTPAPTDPSEKEKLRLHVTTASVARATNESAQLFCTMMQQ
jgi:hypothetical protein